MIYYIAHWDWILKNSRSDIVKELKNDFDITGITPLENHESEIKNDYFQTINWNYKRKKLLDIKGIFNLRKLIKTFNNEDIIHIFTLLYRNVLSYPRYLHFCVDTISTRQITVKPEGKKQNFRELVSA